MRTETEQLRMAMQGLKDLSTSYFVNPVTYRHFAQEVREDITRDGPACGAAAPATQDRPGFGVIAKRTGQTLRS